MEDLQEAIEAFVRDACECLRLYCARLRIEPEQVLALGWQHRRGCTRLPDGRRLVWRVHGVGIYLRVSGTKPVDFDFDATSAGDGVRLVSDGWKLENTRRIEAWTPEAISASRFGVSGRKGYFAFPFHPTTPPAERSITAVGTTPSDGVLEKAASHAVSLLKGGASVISTTKQIRMGFSLDLRDARICVAMAQGGKPRDVAEAEVISEGIALIAAMYLAEVVSDPEKIEAELLALLQEIAERWLHSGGSDPSLIDEALTLECDPRSTPVRLAILLAHELWRDHRVDPSPLLRARLWQNGPPALDDLPGAIEEEFRDLLLTDPSHAGS